MNKYTQILRSGRKGGKNTPSRSSLKVTFKTTSNYQSTNKEYLLIVLSKSLFTENYCIVFSLLSILVHALHLHTNTCKDIV